MVHEYCRATANSIHTIFLTITAPTRHPSNSTGYSLNSTHIYLVWDPPPLEESNGVIREYHINVTERETGTLLQYTTEPDILTLIIGPLHPFYTYNCIIAAYTVDVGPTTEITVVTEEDGRLQKFCESLNYLLIHIPIYSSRWSTHKLCCHHWQFHFHASILEFSGSRCTEWYTSTLYHLPCFRWSDSESKCHFVQAVGHNHRSKTAH